jgi:hypothetical protein
MGTEIEIPDTIGVSHTYGPLTVTIEKNEDDCVTIADKTTGAAVVMSGDQFADAVTAVVGAWLSLGRKS